MARELIQRESRIVVATSTTSVRVGHDIITLRAGEAWDASDPIVKLYPDLFTGIAEGAPVRRTVRPVEQATAAPGERR
jgi:hypothetical protein